MQKLREKVATVWELFSLILFPTGPTCPPGMPRVDCFVDPCLLNFGKCPAHPDATCTADYCGGCNARFFDAEGNEVTDTCACGE